MRPATFTEEQIIEAGLALQTDGRTITGFALRKRIGGGDARRLKQTWDHYISGQASVDAEPVADLPVEVAEEVKVVSAALTERINQLAIELNDKAVRAAERRVAEVTRAAGEQVSQAEQELADATQTVDDLEEKIEKSKDEHNLTKSKLESSRSEIQKQAVELAQLNERLSAFYGLKEKEITELENSNELYRQKLENIQTLYDELQSEHDTDIEMNKEKIQEQSVELAKMHEKSEAKEKRITELEKDNKWYRQKLEDIMESFEKLQSKYDTDIEMNKEKIQEQSVELAKLYERSEANEKQLQINEINALKFTDEMKVLQKTLDQARNDMLHTRESRAELAGEVKTLKDLLNERK